jgi:GH15 family glucan-1,4-alpha-glucosidase
VEKEKMALLEKPAKVIYDAAVSRSGRYRFASGRDAKIVNLMKRVLPEHMLMNLESRMM